MSPMRIRMTSIRAVPNDVNVVTTSVNGRIITIRGIAEGMTTITVSATDDSRQDNAAATPVTFGVGVMKKNSQPVIEAISDQTLEVGDETTIEVNITDVDVEDTHTVSASSDDAVIATVSVNNTTLTITGVVEGTTIITVSATDNSGQDNTAATPLTFKVTVNDPYTPLAGLTVSPGAVVFRAGGLNLNAVGCIFLDGATFNGVRYDIHSFKWQRRKDPQNHGLIYLEQRKIGVYVVIVQTVWVSIGQYGMLALVV